MSWRDAYCCYDHYEKPDGDWDKWLTCPECSLRPLVWRYDNGCSTACGCGKNGSFHLSIYAESINSFVARSDGSAFGYDGGDLRRNWNHYCLNGAILFDREEELEKGKW